eukprot:3462766-Prymnesium_polylepis.1
MRPFVSLLHINRKEARKNGGKQWPQEAEVAAKGEGSCSESDDDRRASGLAVDLLRRSGRDRRDESSK